MHSHWEAELVCMMGEVNLWLEPMLHFWQVDLCDKKLNCFIFILIKARDSFWLKFNAKLHLWWIYLLSYPPNELWASEHSRGATKREKSSTQCHQNPALILELQDTKRGTITGRFHQPGNNQGSMDYVKSFKCRYLGNTPIKNISMTTRLFHQMHS